MYTRQEVSQLKASFWTTFGQYMAPLPSAEGGKINWVNYKTGEKNLHFKMDAGADGATISLELNHPDTGMQQLYFEQLQQLRSLFEAAGGAGWVWKLHAMNEQGNVVSYLSTRIDAVSIYQRADWPALISFFKENMIILDAFWSQVRYSFEALR